ncbi:putative suppressor of exonuclease defects [Nadsonia fulvescens var. elongata DSM 6958]|uniref:Decapping nuclease n=1 Tax=Nadsonia fulvescens var. elongata DSM 6958 TaxID=857566 RepID=A0A1E3PCX4_9ASCO|nr:putative suppressor of exonuclease defects [Nadsonia fulvescens var. elongata DSM 6958]
MELKLDARISKSALRQPKEIGCYSTDISHNYHNDTRGLKYYYFPESSLEDDTIDLNTGYKDFERDPEDTPRHLNGMLQCLVGIEKKTNSKVKADIITYRGIMTRLMCLPYEQREDINLNIVYFDGQIFIEEDFELKKFNKQHMDDRMARMTYWGYKFETLATLAKPWGQSTRAEIDNRLLQKTNNIEEYCSLVRTGVGSVKLILGAEVDCVFDYKPEKSSDDPLPHYVELKTSKVIRTEKDAANFEKKLLKSWAQSFLLGIKTIIYGFRDEDGIVKAIETFETAKIPFMIKASKHTNRKWNGNEAIAFYAACLDWIKTTVPQKEGVVYRLQYRAGSPKLDLAQLTGFEEKKVLDSMLLPEFYQWRESLRKNDTTKA